MKNINNNIIILINSYYKDFMELYIKFKEYEVLPNKNIRYTQLLEFMGDLPYKICSLYMKYINKYIKENINENENENENKKKNKYYILEKQSPFKINKKFSSESFEIKIIDEFIKLLNKNINNDNKINKIRNMSQHGYFHSLESTMDENNKIIEINMKDDMDDEINIKFFELIEDIFKFIKDINKKFSNLKNILKIINSIKYTLNKRNDNIEKIFIENMYSYDKKFKDPHTFLEYYIKTEIAEIAENYPIEKLIHNIIFEVSIDNNPDIYLINNKFNSHIELSKITNNFSSFILNGIIKKSSDITLDNNNHIFDYAYLNKIINNNKNLNEILDKKQLSLIILLCHPNNIYDLDIFEQICKKIDFNIDKTILGCYSSLKQINSLLIKYKESNIKIKKLIIYINKLSSL